MAALFGVANYRDRAQLALARPEPAPLPDLEHVAASLGVAPVAATERVAATQELDMRIKVAGFGGQKVSKISQLVTSLTRLAEVDFGFGKAFVEKIGVTKGKVSRGRSSAGMVLCIGGYARVGFWSAQSGELLSHWPQLR